MKDNKSCPCHYTQPCHKECSCVNPESSLGCLRCCAYGSLEQRKNQAEILADRPLPEIFKLKSYIISLANRLKCYDQGIYGRMKISMKVELNLIEDINRILDKDDKST